MKRTRFILLFLVAAAILAGAVYVLHEDEPSLETSLTVAEALGGDTTGYWRADEVRPFEFPADHGPHPGYKTEWWYLTGNLHDEGGRRFGYQLTIFRIALSPPETRRRDTTSDWATNQLYMGHFTVTDVSGRSFRAFERFSRGAAGLAGARAAPFRVWVEDWGMEGADDSLFPLHVKAREDDAGIDLELRPVKPYVLQGDDGLDRKGPGPGNASYYYSYPRLETEGTVRAGGKQYEVSGLSWMDREWSTSALDPDQSGWDWFALHLSNGTDLMYYQIRQDDGTASPYTSGVLVDEHGEVVALDWRDVRLEVLDTWESPTTGIEYPGLWQLQVAGQQLELTIRPLVSGQELDVSVQYWEGAVAVEGTIGSVEVAGEGYVELTGYGDRADPGGDDGFRGIMSGLPLNRVEHHLGDPGIFIVGGILAGH